MGMERYRAIVRLEEIEELMEKGAYGEAKVIADSIRKERLKDSSDLFLLSSVYKCYGELGTAKEFLKRIYNKKVTWRVLEELMEVCLAEKNPEEAETYLQEYAKISGGDPRNYIYEYRIGRQKHRPDEELLPILQTLKAEEYTEKYAYELAKLYHKLGMEKECVAECADIILWFGEGTYVERAKALQAYYRGELSAEDIKVEAERRVREAEDRRAREEEERLAYEAEQRRLAEDARLAKEEEERLALEEEERLALEGIYRAVAEERFPEEDATEEILQEVLDEVAATETAEPMWEEDVSVHVMPEEETMAEPEKETYQQFSLFEPEEAEEEILRNVPEEAVTTPEQEEEITEPEEEFQEVSELGKELSAKLEEKGIVFEDILHEYARIERVRKQLVRMLEVVVTVRKKCQCLIITGEKKSGKTMLGTYLAKLLYALSYVKSPRVAKISGEKLNQIDLFEKREQLQDVCLIVERAGGMTEDTVRGLLEFIEKTDVLGTVILEDNANAMNRMLRNNGECNRMFNNRVHLPKYDRSELMGFALEIIREQDYEITAEAKKVLGQRIEDLMRREHKDGRLVATLELVKKALDNADNRNQGAILAMASAGDFRAAETLELTVEDINTIQ